VIDLTLMALAVLLGASCLVVEHSFWVLLTVIVFVALELAALAFRRVGLLVAAAAVGAVAFVVATVAGASPRFWPALGLGTGLLVLLDVSWDRVRLLQARLDAPTCARRAVFLLQCAALSGGGLFVAATLGYGAARRLGIALPVEAALCIGVGAAAALALVILGALKRWRREEEEERG
jgi:hypothetical protein